MNRSVRNVIVFGLGALVGGGATYLATRPNVESCQDLQAQQLQGIVEQYKELPATPGVAGQQDIAFQYVVSEEPAFKGLTWKDQQTGDSGVVTRQNVLGQVSYGMQKADLSALSNPAAIAPVQPKVEIVKK